MAYEIVSNRPWFVAKLRKYFASEDLIEGFTTAGSTAIPGGTVQEVLEAIADLADPAG